MSSDEECSLQSREKFIVERSSEPQLEDVNPDFFGPALPPHLLGKQAFEKEEQKSGSYGPILPDYLRNKEKDAQTCLEEPKEKSVIGPEMPEFLKNTQSESFEEESEPLSEVEDFGPSTNLMASDVTADYCRSLRRKSLTQKDEEEPSAQREEWMIELPEKKRACIGLFARQFKTRVPTDKESDSSVWTDTPSNKNKKDKKNDHKAILEMNRLKERDKEMEKLVKKAEEKLKKKKSLLEMHFKHKKKKKKKEAKEKKDVVPERRPFDRNVDLQIRKFDESKRRAIMNKSQFLNDRFAPGQSKFL